jgi:hypothetical protein
MVFTNLIIIAHVNKITNRPPMSSLVAGGHRSAYAANPRAGYQ